MESDKYDITGQPEGQGMPNITRCAHDPALLEDRFKLTTHRETRELSAYALVVASGGPKMTKNDSNPNGLPGCCSEASACCQSQRDDGGLRWCDAVGGARSAGDRQDRTAGAL